MSARTNLSNEPLPASRIKKHGGHRIPAIIFALVMALSVCLLCSACGASSQAKSSSSKSDDYKQETFHGISFSVPKELVTSDSGKSDSMMYTLPESAKNPFAVSLYISAFPFNGNTTQKWYESEKAQGEACEMVSPNGIEMCWVPKDSHSDKDTVYSTLYFVHDETIYMTLLSYDLDAKPSYKEFVENFYKSIKPAGSSANATGKDTEPSNQGSKPAIPSDAVEWTNASKYLGRTATIYGPIVNSTVASSSNGSPTYLDMGAAYPASNRVSIVIWEEDAHNFPQSPVSMYEGKTVCVTGEVYSYSGACNIKVTSPSQIKVVG